MFARTSVGLVGLFLVLDTAHGAFNLSNTRSPLTLRQLVHPVNFTIESLEAAPEDPSSSGGKEEDGRLRCYICSWSIMGKGVNRTNTNTCSTNKFVPERADIKPCDHGCETKAFRTTVKGNITQFYRNCFHPEEGKEVRERCYPTTTVYGIEETCECLSNLCNDAGGLRSSLVPLLPIGLLIGIFSSKLLPC